jgi:hypothetical protein
MLTLTQITVINNNGAKLHMRSTPIFKVKLNKKRYMKNAYDVRNFKLPNYTYPAV